MGSEFMRLMKYEIERLMRLSYRDEFEIIFDALPLEIYQAL